MLLGFILEFLVEASKNKLLGFLKNPTGIFDDSQNELLEIY